MSSAFLKVGNWVFRLNYNLLLTSFLLFSSMALIIVPSSVNAQNHEFTHNPYHGLSDQDLIDRIQLGSDLYWGREPNPLDFYGFDGIPSQDDALFSQLAVEELAYRDMNLDLSVNYAILHNLDTGELFLLDPINYEKGDSAWLYGTADKDLEKYLDSSVTGVLVYEFSSPHLFFYNSLSEIYALAWFEDASINTEFFFGIIREEALSQKAINDYMTSFKSSTLASMPLVRIALRTVSDIVLIDDKFENVTTVQGNRYTKASPSQFDTNKNVIYINSKDLSQYGYVVILHELVQAGLMNSASKGYLTLEDLSGVNAIADTYFPNLSGYINIKKTYLKDDMAGDDVEGISMAKMSRLSSYKAFAIGHTYHILKQQYQNLPVKERAFANKYFKDVERNKFISMLLGEVIPPVSYADSFLVFDGLNLYGDNASKADINEFLNAFTSQSHPAAKRVSSVISKARKAYSKELFKKILPAIL